MGRRAVHELPSVSEFSEHTASPTRRRRMAPRIMIVDVEGVVALDIESIFLTAGCQVVAMTCTGREAMQSAQETIPDLALIHIGLK